MAESEVPFVENFGQDDTESSPPKGARALLAQLLAEALDGSVRVVDRAEPLTPEKGHDLVLVALEEITPGRTSGSRTVKVQVLVATALVTPGTADDALEDRLGEVLDALDGIAWVNWKNAKRTLYTPSGTEAGFPAFNIDTEIEVH